MNYTSLLPLLKSPHSFRPECQAVFKSLVEPLRVVQFCLRNPSVYHLTDKQLERSYAALAKADTGAEQTLDRIDGIAPRTWAAGNRIRMSVGPILETLFEAISIPNDRKRLAFAAVRQKVYAKVKTLDSRSLLLHLRQVSTAESEKLEGQAAKVHEEAKPKRDRPDAASLADVKGDLGTKETVQEQDELMGREREILVALLRLGAFGQRRAVSRLSAAKKADPDDKPASYNRAVASLVRRKLVERKKGPGGGIWLTSEGKRLAQECVAEKV